MAVGGLIALATLRVTPPRQDIEQLATHARLGDQAAR
jgi:hypothetical protein